ncbi:mitochondrial ornithine carrier protein [Lithohypha guttulata]|uniref:Mitochondrial ornithine carrier protein n=1 Tax=Lithohypha guttulata TaxID=1690604 RepID=A0AAN7YCK6_9EURO|nr:mitochondrial ornithine carrier protein [Lithohypha guttulata]KAK5106926.1 mitochondrial ornithine carrier protein [Lithohypha guttulata]
MAVLNHDDTLAKLDSLDEVSPPAVKTDSQGVEALKDILFGSTAGILGTNRLEGPIDAFKQAFRSPEGPIRSLYRGISAPLFGAAVETSSLFFSYRVAQNAYISLSPTLRKEKETSKDGKVELPFTTLLLCGAASGAFTSMALTPIELVKCKMQVVHSNPIDPTTGPNGMARSPSISTIIRSVFRTHGLLGFWHGQLGTLIRETGGSAAWFGSYEGTKILFRKYDKSIERINEVKIWQQMVGGAAAGMSYNFVFYPADTIKSRMQTEETGKTRGTFMGVGRELWRQQGLKGFYRGCGITVFRAAPSSAIIFTIYEALRKMFN